MNAPTPADLVAFARNVEADAAFAGSEIHGALHWRGVAEQALWLTEHLGLSRRLRVAAFAFGAVHDSQRLHDGHDPGHGARAALWLKRSGWLPRLGLADEAAVLLESLVHHDRGRTAPGDALMALGWDADRSLLSRVGVAPSPAFFSLVSGSAFHALVARADAVIEAPASWEVLAGRVVPPRFSDQP